MTDTKPTKDHRDRANACRSLLTRDSFGLVADDDVLALANQFAASDAIARRRAIEEAAEVCEAFADRWRLLSTSRASVLSECAYEIRCLLLRAPPDAKAEADLVEVVDVYHDGAHKRLVCTCAECPVHNRAAWEKAAHGQPSGEGKSQEDARYAALLRVLRDLVTIAEPGASPAVAEACRIARQMCGGE